MVLNGPPLKKNGSHYKGHSWMDGTPGSRKRSQKLPKKVGSFAYQVRKWSQKKGKSEQNVLFLGPFFPFWSHFSLFGPIFPFFWDLLRRDLLRDPGVGAVAAFFWKLNGFWRSWSLCLADNLFIYDKYVLFRPCFCTYLVVVTMRGGHGVLKFASWLRKISDLSIIRSIFSLFVHSF